MSNKKLLIVILLVMALALTCVACASKTNVKIETVSEKINANLKAVDMDIDISALLEESNLQLNTTSSVFDADDKLWVIVETEGGSVADYYLDNNVGMSFKDFAVSEEGLEVASCLVKVQDQVKSWIADARIDIEYKYSYTSIMSGFAANITYSDLALIEALPYVNRVIISEEYAQSETEVSENVGELMQSTGIFANDSNYKGEGMLIAILDNGFDTTHTAFANQLTDIDLTKSDVAEFVSDIYGVATLGKTFTADNIYVSSKIPFAFDYAGKDANVNVNSTSINYYSAFHGTHVAGIVAGDDATITGSAPMAQLALMKVFGDYTTGAKTTDIVAALGDCTLIGVDAINMSLGSPAGFTYERSSDLQYVNEMYGKIEKLGIMLCVSAGNETNASYTYKTGAIDSSNPDSGVLGSPASYDAAFAVASVNSTLNDYMKTGDGSVLFNRAVDTSSVAFDIPSLILGEEEQKTLEVVVIGGIGEDSDYEGIDVTGKAVLVFRGETSFETKQLVAFNHGAIACIIGNNTTGVINAQITGELKIPTMTIRQYDAEMLKANAIDGKFEVTFGKDFITSLMSSFSSWGPLSDLTLKPDITAPGGNIYSSMPKGYTGGLYAYLSGTSMASPNMAGLITCVKQYLASVYPEATEIQLRDMSYQLIQSTATQAIDAGGHSASVRSQGAGVANLEKALNTQAYLTVTGSNRTKLELGDDKNKDGVYTLAFNVVNMSSDVLSYSIDVETLTETLNLDGVTLAERSHLLNKGTVEVYANGYVDGVLTVAANATVRIKIVITLADEEKAHLDKCFENGMYVEGFARLLNENEEGVDLSIPFLAFYGDWTKAPIFDETLYENPEGALIYPINVMGYLGTYSTYISMGYEASLFALPEGVEGNRPSSDKIALTVDEDGICSIYSVYMSTFRNISYMEYNLYDSETGYVYYNAIADNVRKTYYNGTDIVIAGHELWIDPLEYDLANNQTLVLTVDAYLDVEGKYSYAQLKFPVYIDYEKPQLLNSEIRVEDGRTYVDLSVYDNHYFESYLVCTPTDASATTLGLLNNFQLPVRDWVKGQNGMLTLDITDYIPMMYEGEFYVALQDCAHNQSIYYIGNFLPEVEKEGANALAINPDSIDAKFMESMGITFVHDESYDELMALAIEGYKLSLVEDVYSTNGEVVHESGEHKFTVNDAGELTKYEGPGGDVVIPDDIGVKTILGTTDVFRDRKDIISVTLPSTCTTIGARAFRGCSIQYCNVPETLSVIEQQAFYQAGLKEFDMPDAVTALTGSWTFAYTQLTEINLSANLQGAIGSSCFQGCKYLETLYVPDGVNYINGSFALRCENVKSIRMSPYVTYLGNYSISHCFEMETFNFSDLIAVTYWGQSNFSWDMKMISDVVINDPGSIVTLSAMSFAYCFSIPTVTIYANLKQCNTVFDECDSVTSVKFYGNPGNIAGSNFIDNMNLETLEFYGDVGNIGGNYWAEFSFSHTAIKSVHFYGNVEGITGTNFSNCPNLEEVVFHKNIGSINQYPFGNSEKLTHFSISEDNEYLVYDEETKIVYNKEMTKMFVPSSWDYDGVLVIPETVTTLTNGMFGIAWRYLNKTTFTYTVSENVVSSLQNRNHPTVTTEKPLLKGIVLNANITTIPTYCFAGFTGLEYIDFNGAPITNIGTYAFYNSGIKELKLPDTVTYVGDYAFAESDNLTSVDLGAALVTIDEYAFSNAVSLESVVLPDTLTTIYDYAFENAALKSLYIPAGVVSMDPTTAFSGVYTLEEITVSENNIAFCAIDDALLSKDVAVLYKYAAKSASESFVVPEAVLVISEYAFYDAINLKAIEFNNVEYIEKFAFYGSALESVSINGCVDFIETKAFAEMAINELSINGQAGMFDYSYVFYNTDIANITLVGEQQYFAIDNGLLTNVIGNVIYDCITPIEGTLTIAEGVTRIMPFAFQNETGITELVMPSTLKSIGAAAFYGCTGLTKITFNSENAPRFEAEYDYEEGEVNYCNFVTDLANVPEGGLEIQIVCPNNDSYFSNIWKLYFGMVR
ncbi:MAG: leucine-rich repeat protein [Clostridia bacterium]|nr:leucine-rich repeat protein [Clostridia bacterium]